MGRALPNFRELAELERQEPKMVQMVERFEAERSDMILQNLEESLRFMRMIGDVANLFFPVMFDTLITGGNNGLTPNEEALDEDFLDEEDEDLPNGKKNPPGSNAPDQMDDGPKGPGSDGPTQS